MRRLIVALVLLAAPALAQAQAQPEKKNPCYEHKTPPEARVGYCTREIESGRLNTTGLANAYASRAHARFLNKDTPRALSDANTAVSLDSASIYAWVVQAEAYRQMGQAENAKESYRTASGLSVESADDYNNRGIAFVQLGDEDRGIADYDQAISLDPTLAYPIANRGRVFARKAQYDRAIADYNQAIRLDPADADSYASRGFSYYRNKDYDRAIADYSQAIRLDPANAGFYASRGGSYYEKKDHNRAIADHSQAIRLDPTRAGAYKGRGQSYHEKKDYDRAIADYEQAIRLAPGDAGLKNAMCWTRAVAGQDLSRALPYCNEAIALAPREAAYLDSRGLVHLKASRPAEAEADYNHAATLKPKTAHYLFGRAVARLRQGDSVRGIADLEAARAIDPKIDETYAGYGVTLAGTAAPPLAGPPDRSNAAAICADFQAASSDRIQHCTQLIDSKTLSGAPWAAVLASRAEAYRHAGQPARAIADLGEAIAIDPLNSKYFYVRSLAFEDNGQKDRATDDADRYWELTHIQAGFGTPFTQLRNGRFREARDHYDRLVAGYGPRISSYTHFGRGLARLRSGDAGGAADLDRARQRNKDIDGEFTRYGLKP